MPASTLHDAEMHRRALGKGVGVTAIVPGDKARARARAHASECVVIDRADLRHAEVCVFGPRSLVCILNRHVCE